MLRFSKEERNYIVNNYETDLALTEAGLQLIERYKEADEFLVVNVESEDCNSFLETLRREYVRKSQRLPDSRILTSLARRLLEDFESIEPMTFD